jgi:glycosyltransferase involved in cell wall biosynthesis
LAGAEAGTEAGVRVALISPYPVPGGTLSSGVEPYTARLAAALAAAGAVVTVVAQRADGQPTENRDGPVRVVRAWRRGARAVPTAARAALRLGAQVVHLQHEVFLYGGAAVTGLPLGLTLLRRSGTGPVVTLHQVVDPAAVDDDFVDVHRVRVPAPMARAGLGAIQEMCGRLGVAVVHERTFADHVRGATVIPLGVDPVKTAGAPARAAAKKAVGLDPSRFTVLCFGFLSPYKGLEAALDAARRAGPEVEMVVAGGPHPRLGERDPYASGLERRYGARARFTGFVPEAEVATWFSAADLVLIPYPRPFSSSGAFSVALGLGRPVLLSAAMARAAGAPTVMAVEVAPEPLTARLLELARRPEARAELAAASVALAAERTWPAVAHRHLELYGEVIGGKRRAAGAGRAA